MSNKRRKKHRLTVTKLHKAMSRTAVGHVRPTLVEKGRKGGKGGAHKADLKNITLDGVALDEVIKTDEEIESTKGSLGSSLHARPYVPTSGTYKQKYSGRTLAGETPFSDEVKEHFKYLTEAKGDEVAHRYLDSVRGKHMVGTDPTPHLGPIEKAIKEAEEKEKFYKHQAIVSQQEEQKWKIVRERLQEALNLSTGRTKLTETKQGVDINKPLPGSVKKRERRDWPTIFTEVLCDCKNGLSRTELKNRLVEKTGAADSNIYYAINQGLERDLIVDIDGKFVLATDLAPSTKEDHRSA